jgi:hypothetical protein
MRKTFLLLSLLAALAGVRPAAACEKAAVVVPHYVQAVVAPSYQVQAFAVPYAEAVIVAPGVTWDAGRGGFEGRMVQRLRVQQGAKQPVSILLQRRSLLGRRQILVRP